MRIISGKMRGTVLKSLAGDITRPTADRVKEGLFSAIQFELEGATVLDAFAGSGQLSLEALSRGAKFAFLCEKDKNAFHIIKENIERTRCNEIAEAVNLPFENAVPIMKKYAPFDIVFLDPPYKSLLWVDAINKLEEETLLRGKCVIVCECPKDYHFPVEFSRYQSREYHYGSTKVVIFRK